MILYSNPHALSIYDYPHTFFCRWIEWSCWWDISEAWTQQDWGKNFRGNLIFYFYLFENPCYFLVNIESLSLSLLEIYLPIHYPIIFLFIRRENSSPIYSNGFPLICLSIWKIDSHNSYFKREFLLVEGRCSFWEA